MKLVLSILVFLLSSDVLGADEEWIDRHYEPSSAPVTNPERGLYVELADRRQRPLESQRLQELTGEGITLVQRLYYLKGYRDRPLDRAQLDLIANDFVTIREAGMKVILRFAYSSRIGEPDAPLEVVLGHIEQLRPLLRENSDLILTVQAGFIGAWGEWHASTNGLTEPAAKRRIATALLDALPEDRTIQVRTPIQKQRLVSNRQPLTPDTLRRGSLAARIGHHNDCFLADTTDMGTYRDRHLDEDRAYVAADSLLTPVGGETCQNGSLSDPAFAREEFARMHWTFLNRAYHRGVIAKWRDSGFLNEITKNLGYRLRPLHARVQRSVAVGKRLKGTVVMTNDGWAAPIHDRPVRLLLIDDQGATALSSPIPVDVRDLLPQKQLTWEINLEIPKDLDPGKYALQLWLPDPSPRLSDDPRYALRFDAQGAISTPNGANDLGIRLRATKPRNTRPPSL